MKPKTFVFIGRSGCGKGTQSKLLATKLKEISGRDSYTMVIGDKLREFIKGDTFSQRKAKEIMDMGNLQPSFVAIYAWSSLLIENVNGEDHLITDGIPRKLDETIILDNAFEFYERDRVVIIDLEVSEDWSRKRMLERGRHDDTEESITKRLAWYREYTQKSIDYYEKHDKHLFLRVNGEQSIEQVHQEIMDGVKDYLKS